MPSRHADFALLVQGRKFLDWDLYPINRSAPVEVRKVAWKCRRTRKLMLKKFGAMLYGPNRPSFRYRRPNDDRMCTSS